MTTPSLKKSIFVTACSTTIVVMLLHFLGLAKAASSSSSEVVTNAIISLSRVASGPGSNTEISCQAGVNAQKNADKKHFDGIMPKIVQMQKYIRSPSAPSNCSPEEIRKIASKINEQIQPPINLSDKEIGDLSNRAKENVQERLNRMVSAQTMSDLDSINFSILQDFVIQKCELDVEAGQRPTIVTGEYTTGFAGFKEIINAFSLVHGTRIAPEKNWIKKGESVLTYDSIKRRNMGIETNSESETDFGNTDYVYATIQADTTFRQSRYTGGDDDNGRNIIFRADHFFNGENTLIYFNDLLEMLDIPSHGVRPLAIGNGNAPFKWMAHSNTYFNCTVTLKKEDGKFSLDPSIQVSFNGIFQKNKSEAMYLQLIANVCSNLVSVKKSQKFTSAIAYIASKQGPDLMQLIHDTGMRIQALLPGDQALDSSSGFHSIIAPNGAVLPLD
ncbi:MAG: hypothetical protein HQK53_01290 [Oligoflexia bacterium]|nr:hypothetical protein [Oligoflexia bacterium]